MREAPADLRFHRQGAGDRAIRRREHLHGGAAARGRRVEAPGRARGAAAVAAQAQHDMMASLGGRDRDDLAIAEIGPADFCSAPASPGYL